MSDRSNDNNLYKPPITGILVGAIALLLLVIVILVSAILAMNFSDQSGKGDETDAPKQSSVEQTEPKATDKPEVTDPVVTDPPSATNPPSVPTRVPVKVSPTETTLTLDSAGMYDGSLLLIDENHTYMKDASLLIPRSELSKLSASTLLEKYNFVRIDGNTGKFTISDSDKFLKSDALYYFYEMMNDFVDESGKTDVQVRNAYYHPGSDLESFEHATGYYVDLQIYVRPGEGTREGTYPLNYETKRSVYYNWFIEHCWEYGFIHVRDIENKYSTFRFVGAAHAAAMNKTGLDLEQYLEEITQYSYTNRMKVTDGFGWEWWVYYVSASGADTTLPVIGNEQSYHISGDNLDGFVVAINSSCFA